MLVVFWLFGGATDYYITPRPNLLYSHLLATRYVARYVALRGRSSVVRAVGS
jgi:hypothetical protein